jgi:hypothetical protein
MKLVMMVFGNIDGTYSHLAYDLSQFNFFIQSQVKKFLLEGIKLTCLETIPGTRKTFEYEKYDLQCHVYVKKYGVFGAIVSDYEYPTRIAFSLLNEELKLGFDVNQKFKDWQNPQSQDKLLDTGPPVSSQISRFRDYFTNTNHIRRSEIHYAN